MYTVTMPPGKDTSTSPVFPYGGGRFLWPPLAFFDAAFELIIKHTNHYNAQVAQNGEGDNGVSHTWKLKFTVQINAHNHYFSFSEASLIWEQCHELKVSSHLIQSKASS